MPRKKKEDEIEETTVETVEAQPADEVAVEAAADEVPETAVEAAAEEAVVAEEPVSVKEEKPKSAKKTSAKTDATDDAAEPDTKKRSGKRAEKVGIVSSDKMMKTVVVRVDRLVKHPIYRKYVKKRKKFMAHDDLGAKIGDTRPLSARKRWRVVEIIQKAEL
jgi:small subunit ribosomal protein S17